MDIFTLRKKKVFMIDKFVKTFMEHKRELRQKFTKHPDSYFDVVKAVVELLNEYSEGKQLPSPNKIKEISYGSYRGDYVYLISDNNEKSIWVVKVEYGTCSHCDTLTEIKELSYGKEPTEEQKDHYMTLALHIIQDMKQV